MSQTVTIEIAGARRSLVLEDAPDLLGPLRQVLGSWPVRIMNGVRAAPGSSAGEAGEEAIRVRGMRGGRFYEIDSPYLDGRVTEQGEAAAVCGVVVDLVRAYVDADPALLCLHCGAVEIGGRAVVFPDTYRAGKSTLVAQLAADGVRVLADDVLPVAPDGTGRALGLAPRLRLPLPPAAGPALTALVRERAGPSDSRYQYLALAEPALAAHGASAPIGAVVSLKRVKAGPARLTTLDADVAAQRMILRNFGRRPGASAILERLAQLAAGIPAFELRYTDLAEASHLLREHFADWSALPDAPGPGARRGRTGRRRPIPAAAVDSPLVRRSGVVLRRVGPSLFAAVPESDAIFRLDAVGAAVWALLEVPVHAADCAAVLADAFPDVAPARIRADLDTLLADMMAADLIRPG